MFNLKTKAVYSKLAAFVFCGKISYRVIVYKDLFLLQNNEGELEYYDK